MNLDNVKSLTIGGQAVKSLSIGGQVVWVKGVKLYDYLENTNTAYINTLISDPNIRVELVCEYTEVKSSSQVMFGKGGSGGDWFGSNNGSWAIGVTTEYKITSDTLQKTSINLEYSKSGSNQSLVLTINGNSVTRTATAASYNNFIIFNSSGYTFPSLAKLYSAKIYDENDNLLVNLKPCTYNGEAGLWDMVNGVFYGNANSSGAFTVGNE